MRALFERIKKFAPHDVSVLIQGETGTGKELVATAIHLLSTRDRIRLTTVNCGALTRELLLSELFGHERGAFTGAIGKKRGLLAVADGGTVFLDEIGDLPLDAQVMLLRFLQSGEVRPVGSTETSRVNVRVIAATHRDLAGAVEDGAFRADLYHRLHRFVLTIPPLRARREDVSLLVEHFRAQLNARHHLSVQGVTRQALRVLEQCPWRGNVRELEAVLEPAMVLKGAGWITPKDIELAPLPGERVTAEAGVAGERGTTTSTDALTWLQREALRIRAANGEVRRADLVARCRVSHELARRALAGLARLGLLRRVGLARATRYVSLSFWLTCLDDAAELVLTLV
jgi:transcriptional regulator with GAF, ATPase, and Fis domain